MANNPNQTPVQNFDNVATIKAILEQSEKTKTERTNTELKLGNKDVSKLLAPAQQDIRTPSPPKSVSYLIVINYNLRMTLFLTENINLTPSVFVFAYL